MAPVRVLVVFGTESGSAEAGIKRMAKTWGEKSGLKFKVCDIKKGDDAADSFDSIKTDYDAVLVCTSSFGDGDAPSGYGKFLYKLYEGSKADVKPLEGIQHAVLGYGSMAYDTFQNCPRLTDKLLGESGSRRFVQRGEIDECDSAADRTAVYDTFEKTVFAALQDPNFATSKGAKPVCEWTQPKDQILEKNLGPDGYEVEVAGSGGNAALVGMAAVIIALLVAYFKS